MKFGILLSGCGVYDGAEIHESVFSMLAVAEAGHDYQCVSVNKNQHHVVNHLNGEEMPEERNMMVEAARIARGDVKEISEINPGNIDGLIIPGGFGSAKNFSDWAFKGPDGDILPEVKLLIVNMINAGKPIVALCVSPVLVAKALEDSDFHAQLTLGNTTDASPYEISGFHAGIEQVGAVAAEKATTEVLVDENLKVITAPCYMMEANVVEVRKNIQQAVLKMIELI